MAIDPGRAVLEAFLLANAGGPVDATKNAILGRVLFAFPLEPDEVRVLAAQARQAAGECASKKAGDPFTPENLYERICELAWEDGDVESDRSVLEPLRHALDIDPVLAAQLLAAAECAPRRSQTQPPPPDPEPPRAAPPPPAPPPPELKLHGSPRFFEESGRCWMVGLPIFVCVSIVSACVLGMLYGPLNELINIAQIAIFLPIGLGCLIGWIISVFARPLRIRNRYVIAAVTLLASLLADYCAFLTFVAYVFKQSLSVVCGWGLRLPLEAILAKGTWSLSHDSPVKGMELLTIWILELLFIVVFAVGVAWRCHRNNMYCESCDQWYSRLPARYVGSRMERSDMQTALNTGDLRSLHRLDYRENQPHVRIEKDACPICRTDTYLSVTWRQLTYAHDGKPVWNETLILDKLAIPRHVAGILFR